MKQLTTFFYLFLMLVSVAVAQTPQQQARTLSRQGLSALDSGDVKAAMKFFKQAQQLDTANINYQYQVASVHFLGKDFKQVVRILRPLMSHRDVSPNMIRLLANSYDNLGQQEKAIEFYKEGIKLSPHDGKFYHDLGNIYLMKKQREIALEYFETGILEDAKFINNCYWAAKVHLNGGNIWWGLLYGELFANAERNSARTYEMSKLLYDTYTKIVVQSSNSTWRIQVADSCFTSKFGKNCGDILKKTTLNIHGTTIEKVALLRQAFVKEWLATPELKANFPHLIHYWILIDQEDYTIPYIHWLLNQGDEAEFEQWTNDNAPQFSRFITWFVENPIDLTKQKWSRKSYE